MVWQTRITLHRFNYRSGPYGVLQSRRSPEHAWTSPLHWRQAAVPKMGPTYSLSWTGTPCEMENTPKRRPGSLAFVCEYPISLQRSRQRKTNGRLQIDCFIISVGIQGNRTWWSLTNAHRPRLLPSPTWRTPSAFEFEPIHTSRQRENIAHKNTFPSMLLWPRRAPRQAPNNIRWCTCKKERLDRSGNKADWRMEGIDVICKY